MEHILFQVQLCSEILIFKENRSKSIKIDKTGVNKKTGGEGIYAPLAFTIMSAILCYGLANKIYV